MAVYACSDLHGRYDIYENICKMLMPDDKVYFLGDANDRGPDGWKLIKAIINNPQFVYIKGNHEQMLVDAGKAVLEGNYYSKSVRLLMRNAGYGTLCDWQQEEERFQADWLNYIDKLPTYQVYQNIDGLIIFLSHAGCTPHTIGDELFFSTDLLWNRTHFREAWAKGCEDVITVHVIRPTVLLMKKSMRFEMQKYSLVLIGTIKTIRFVLILAPTGPTLRFCLIWMILPSILFKVLRRNNNE